LPGDAVAIPEPAAAVGLAAAREQPVPEAVDLGLIGAVDLEGDRVGVLHPHAAVQRHEALAGERELNDQHRTRLAAWAVDIVSLDRLDLRARQ
jgi:hypothetical protein